jgi:hypothetical protein
MDWPLLTILLVVSIWLITTGLNRPGKVYEYPFLAGTTFLGFVLPQLPAYANNPYLPQGAFAKTVLLTILCAAACGVGWAAGNRPLRMLAWRFDERRLLWVAAVLSLVGSFFYYKISRLPKWEGGGGWTGLPTIYIFFSRLVQYGSVTALLCFMRRPRASSLAIALFGTVLLADRIVVGGRREELVEFLVAIAIAAWFQRGIAVPRVIALAGTLGAGVALASTGDYRNVSMDQDSKWSQVLNIHLIENFGDLLKNGGLEMNNAILLVNFADQTQSFDFGAFNWNELVFAFVPAQFVGSRFKESLMLPLPRIDRDYNPVNGTTETGMTDAFQSFWYFGAAKFLLIAYLLGRIYRAAVAGSTVARLLFILSVTPAMMAITHHTQVVFSMWVQMGIFLLPALALARVKAPIEPLRGLSDIRTDLGCTARLEPPFRRLRS